MLLIQNLNNLSFDKGLEILGITGFNKDNIIKLSSFMNEYNNAKDAIKK